MVSAASTVEELLDCLGYEGEAKEQALASIEEYSESCYAGVDAQFGKDTKAMQPIETPPFYGTFEDFN